ncbi:MAG: nucleoid occlusion protein [Clostridia bacterium]|nr:nucleoid occlusion protein [Clostridia bacterium]MDD4145820.1 nucleoid occlusion protein [Clostridia bacterium]
MVRESLSRMWSLFNEEKSEQIRELQIALVRPNPYQPRKYFDSFQLEELAKSIKQFGVIQPIIVRQRENYYELIAGERRLRASQNIGKKTIPAIVKVMSNQEVAEIALIENLQREDLNYFEEAEGYQRLLQEFNLTQEEVAQRVGKSQSTIANKLRLLKLPLQIRNNISVDTVTERHARALLRLSNMGSQIEVLKEIYQKELNVRETEALIETRLTANDDSFIDKKKKRIVRVFTDIRIYLNTLKAAVATISEAGVEIKMREKNYENYVEVLIQIYKP